MQILIVPEPPDSVDAQTLIDELDGHLTLRYPAESRHGYSVAKLLQENVAFFVIRCDGVAAGCGGVKLFGTEYGEVKRMYVRSRFRGLGLGKLMLDHLAAYARKQEVGVLRLETGVYQQEAIGLYERVGFYQITPFGVYQEDPLSKFYEKQIGM